MDFSSHNPTTSNSLNLAARNNDVANLRRLLKKMNPNCVDNRGWTCLHEAAHSDSYECLELILKHPNCRPLAETHEGHTALYIACRNRASVKTITYLLENVKDFANYSSTEGVAPLHEVCNQGRLEIIQLLLDHGANIDVVDLDGDTPLHDACIARQPDAIKLLLHAGANPNIQNERLFTPFHIACSGPCMESVVNLIDFIKDINQSVDTGDTPLMISLHSDNILLPTFLLRKGADPNVKNNDGKLALDVAVDLGHSYVFEKLLQVTDHLVINENIICRACKPHYFSLSILGALLSSDLGPRFFQFAEPYRPNNHRDCFGEVIHEVQPYYSVHSPLNAFMDVCEYIYKASKQKFKKYFNLFLTRGVPVNASKPWEFPPLAYIHYVTHTHCFEDVFNILVANGCNVDYCGSGCAFPRVTDAFIASLTMSPRTAIIMLPYSLYCDPGTIIAVIENNGLVDRVTNSVINSILQKIDNKETTLQEYHTTVPSLKHLSRLSVRGAIKAKDGVLKSTQEFLRILNELPVPQIIKNYLRFT